MRSYSRIGALLLYSVHHIEGRLITNGDYTVYFYGRLALLWGGALVVNRCKRHCRHIKEVGRRARMDAFTIYLGDCLEVLKELPDASVDSIITDPI